MFDIKYYIHGIEVPYELSQQILTMKFNGIPLDNIVESLSISYPEIYKEIKKVELKRKSREEKLKRILK